MAELADVPAAQRGGAKALLLTVLGEFVLPGGGAAWTSTMVSAAAALDIGEKNARQALARIRDQGLIEGERHGRAVRWSLTKQGHDLLESGTRRIYSFGINHVEWNQEWLVAHCPVGESQRALRNELRRQLGFLGFGELSASLLVSPHVGREPELRKVLADLGLTEESIILRSTTAADDHADLVRRAWDLDGLEASYRAFAKEKQTVRPQSGQQQFCALVELVHDWRRFPYTDPELPTELLPDAWAGRHAAEIFHERHQTLSPGAQAWFAGLESRT